MIPGSSYLVRSSKRSTFAKRKSSARQWRFATYCTEGQDSSRGGFLARMVGGCVLSVIAPRCSRGRGFPTSFMAFVQLTARWPCGKAESVLRGTAPRRDGPERYEKSLENILCGAGEDCTNLGPASTSFIGWNILLTVNTNPNNDHLRIFSK